MTEGDVTRSRYQRYASYKPSGVEWLGDVPEHWEVVPVSRVFRVVNGGTPSADEVYWDGHINWITPEDLGRNSSNRINDSRRKLSVDGLRISGATLVPPDSIILSTRAPIGHIAIADVSLSTNQGCRSLVASRTEVHSDYFFYLLLSQRDVLQAFGKGSTFMELPGSNLAAHVVSLPPLEEQRGIAAFLDAETARIDSLIEKKRALIEKLKEQRTALISRTVTRGLPPDAARAAGLDPHPRLKPSGIEWLGDVPEHWEVKSIGKALDVVDCKHITVEFVDEGVAVASIREVHGFEIDLRSAKRTTEEQYLEMIEGGRRPKVGDIVYSRNATVGDAALVTTSEPFCLGQDVCLIGSRNNWPRFILYSLHSSSMVQQLESVVLGATFRRINVGQIRTFLLMVPPVDEQRAVADFLDAELSKLQAIEDLIQSVIDLLSELRGALITAAVTGKIDVRQYVPPADPEAATIAV